MPRRKLTDREALDRMMARRQILAAATSHSRKRVARLPRLDGFVFLPKPYTGRTLQQAVNVCRSHRLVKDNVLVAAGFNAQKAAA